MDHVLLVAGRIETADATGRAGMHASGCGAADSRTRMTAHACAPWFASVAGLTWTGPRRAVPGVGPGSERKSLEPRLFIPSAFGNWEIAHCLSQGGRFLSAWWAPGAAGAPGVAPPSISRGSRRRSRWGSRVVPQSLPNSSPPGNEGAESRRAAPRPSARGGGSLSPPAPRGARELGGLWDALQRVHLTTSHGRTDLVDGAMPRDAHRIAECVRFGGGGAGTP